MKFLIFGLIFFLQIAKAQSDLYDSSSEIFKHFYYNSYQERFCFKNITSFLQVLHQEGVNLSQAYIIKINNDGTSMFGLVHGEFARTSILTKSPTEKNWSYHVILEMNGLVYDFDFGNWPFIVPVNSYFKKMFFDDFKDPSGKRLYVGATRKIEEYVITRTSASFFLENNNLNEKTISLKDYLRIFQTERSNN